MDVVRLNQEERERGKKVVDKLPGTSQKAGRADGLLKVCAGKSWRTGKVFWNPAPGRMILRMWENVK